MAHRTNTHICPISFLSSSVEAAVGPAIRCFANELSIAIVIDNLIGKHENTLSYAVAVVRLSAGKYRFEEYFWNDKNKNCSSSRQIVDELPVKRCPNVSGDD
jgi:hypothetical protein